MLQAKLANALLNTYKINFTLHKFKTYIISVKLSKPLPVEKYIKIFQMKHKIPTTKT